MVGGLKMDGLFARTPWKHQRFGVEKTIEAFTNGTKSLCLTSPTGSGKSLMMTALANWKCNRGGKVLILTNRILLTEQTRRVFEESNIGVGVISASMKWAEREDARVQIATVQTILAKQRDNPDYWVDADLVLADEIHQVSSNLSADLLNAYKERGNQVCGVTATPLGVSNVCDELIVAARTRDLQKQGVLCPALWFAPSELDTRKLVKGRVDMSLSETDVRKTWGPLRGDDKIRTRIVGNIMEHYERIHPEQTHTLAFAPGVKESLWAAQFCFSRGIRSLHMDASDFWVDGKLYDRKHDEKLFQDSIQEWRDGKIPILWNRFIWREGLDEPQIKCIMLATPVGSYRSFLQMVGRGLRVHDSKEHLKVIDYGGNWWRHGSVNVNVDWESVFYCDDPDTISKNRIAEQRENGEPMGQVCPKCGVVHKIHSRLIYCQFCQHKLSIKKPSRPILQADGTLTQVSGEPIKQWKIRRTPDAEKIWEGLYHNAVKKANKEIKEARAEQRDFDKKKFTSFDQLYQQAWYKTATQAGSYDKPAFGKAYHFPRDLPFMPTGINAFHQNVHEVPREKLL